MAKRLWLRLPTSAGRKAGADYGVVIGDAEATDKLREEMRTARGQVKDFDLGPEFDDILARAEDETGLPTPALQEEPLAWAPLESAEDAMKRVRSKAGI